MERCRYRVGFVGCMIALLSGLLTTVAPAWVGAEAPPFSFVSAPGSPLLTDVSRYHIAVGDFNGDGKIDLAALVFSSATSPMGMLSVFLGNGDGTFRQVSADLPTGSGIITAVTAGDFDGDGKVDLAVGNTIGSGNISGAVNILLGNGDGTFRAGPTIALSATSVGDLAAGDLNGDGKADLVARAGDRSGDARVLLNRGDATFAVSTPLPLGNSVGQIAVRDLNGDGKGDLVAVIESTGVTVLLGNGDGTFREPPGAPLPPSPIPGFSVAVGDFTGDGKLDLAIGNVGDENGGGFAILPGDGDGTVNHRALPFERGVAVNLLAAGDFNGDGRDDLIVDNRHTVAGGPNGNRGDLSVLLNITGSTPPPSPSPGAYAFGPLPAFPDTPDHRFFAATSHSLNTGFKTYWEANGGLDQFGYPVSEEFTDRTADGREHITQWFERARFEYYPENQGTPYAVQLGLLGREATASRTGEAPFSPIAAFPDTPDHRFFAATGHSLNSGFKAYWETHGGLAQFGYPISEEFTEKNQDTGQDYTVQYFERERFEYHPEFARTPYEVELGRLGAQVALARGYPVNGQVAPTPGDPLSARFAALLATNARAREALGVPGGMTSQSPGAALDFEHGRMLSFQAGVDVIAILCGDDPQAGQVFVSSRLTPYYEAISHVGQATGSLGSQPGLYEPQGDFGQIWRMRPGVRECLGDATAPDATFYTATVQIFAREGALVSTPDGQAADALYLVGETVPPNGRYERFALPTP